MKTKKVDDGGRRWRCIDEEVDVDEDGDVDEDVECRLTFSLVVDTVQRLLEFRAQRHGSSSSPKLTPQTSLNFPARLITKIIDVVTRQHARSEHQSIQTSCRHQTQRFRADFGLKLSASTFPSTLCKLMKGVILQGAPA